MRIRTLSLFATLSTFWLSSNGTALANSYTNDPSPATDAAPTPSAEALPLIVQADDNDDAALQLAEPDFRLINLPTTLRLPLHKSNFDLTHRFNGNLRRGTFGDNASDFFGLDEGAVVGFEFRFALARHVQAAAYRSVLSKTVQFYGKYDALHQGGSRPFSVSALVSVEGADNFHTQYSPALGGIVSRTIGTVAALYATPIWVHNTDAVAGVQRDTFFVGLGGRVRIARTVYVSAEVSPRVNGYVQGSPEFGFALEKRAGGHMFQLNFTNTNGTTFGQIARGGFPDALYLGFNLSRKFF
jgi:uncharacterized beta barrel domain-containing protein DUF5777